MRQSYERDGYVFPLKVMTPDRAAKYRATPTFAHLVAGENRLNNFELLQPASALLASGEVSNARLAIAMQERIGYAGAADPGKRSI